VAAGVLVLVALALIWVQKNQLDNLKKENSKLERAQGDLSRKVETLLSLGDKYNQCNGELEDLRLRLKEHREDSSNQLKQQGEKITAGEEKIKTLTDDVEALNKKVGELNQRHVKTKKTRLSE
jgi:predicted  nucleic acid-binding Zn-ribbon protein